MNISAQNKSMNISAQNKDVVGSDIVYPKYRENWQFLERGPAIARLILRTIPDKKGESNRLVNVGISAITNFDL